jgi:hypothetical protein
MTETLTKPRVDRTTGTAPPMIHWLDPKRPGYALCGTKIVKFLGKIDASDCVVCDQMRRG